MATGKSTANKRISVAYVAKKILDDSIPPSKRKSFARKTENFPAWEKHLPPQQREPGPNEIAKCGCGSLCHISEMTRNRGECDDCAIKTLGNGDDDEGKRLLEERKRSSAEHDVLMAHCRSGKGGIFERGMPAAKLSGVAVGTGKEVYVIDVDTCKVYLYQLVGEQTREGVKDVETGHIVRR